MGFGDMSKKQIEEMIKTEIKTLNNFLQRIDEETEYDVQAFAKISFLDEKEMDIRSASLHFGIQHIVKTLVLNDEWIKSDLISLKEFIKAYIDKEEEN